eukprot:TRINITY_DN4379_c0_g1_i3.p1 TRINITY_DN4379_c0_g1~~TRINITY_DN4379_c0_g1_i3.p1  ORF type:complete len:523 (-),score=135.94 TRINITY_DN4379_c0_g1_i3:71-1546(-)
MTEASLLSDKLRRYGTLGAGIVGDSMATIRMAQASSSAASDSQQGATSSGYPASTLTRDQILDVLAETVRVQSIVQQEVSDLARRIAKERKSEGKKKKKSLSLLEGHKKVKELNLPKEPLEEIGITDAAFQRLLTQYEEDEEVMLKARELVHPVGKGDPERAKSITIDKIVEIHQFMVAEMQKVLTEFLSLDQETRSGFTSKACETTAELLVSIAVEQHLSVHCEDVEQAVIRYEQMLQGNAEFARCTEQLANMMQHLTSAAQPRVEKASFLKALRHIAESTQKAKVFAKKLYEEYRAKTCNVVDAYRRFEEFADSATQSAEGLEEDLTPVEMQLCFDEYRDDPQVREAWTQAGAESSFLMSSMMTGRSPSSGSAAPEDKKVKKTKPSEIVEMQDYMVDELKRICEAASTSMAGNSSATPWRQDIAMQMVQALASASVERRFGVGAEEMTMAGFQHAAALQKSERFVRATEKQQEILMQVAQLCSPAPAGE